MRTNQPSDERAARPLQPNESEPLEPEQKPSEPVEPYPIKPDRTKEIIEKATDLYENFKAASFSRDSYIELGESIKKGKTFKEVHPVVQRLIMKVAKAVHRID
jgi:hypothetical protein